MSSMQGLSLFLILCMARRTFAGPPSEAELRTMFARFQERYKKDYANDDAAMRFAAFKENIARAIALNKAQSIDCIDLFDSPDCIFGVTPFSDMPESEFKAKMTGYKHSKRIQGLHTMQPHEYEKGYSQSQWDWRSQGKVSPIKDQNPCGVCWAFSATGTIESAYAIASGGSPPILSPEQIVDCDGNGCNGGGDPQQAFGYVQQQGGLESENNYPTTCCNEGSGQVGQCAWNQNPAVVVTGASLGPSQSEDALAAAVVSQGPFSIIVDASGWQQYSGGSIFPSSGCGQNIDHAVAVVGFDKTGDTPYWIVRNSWGTWWGDQGYMKLEYGQNACALLTEPSIAQVAGGPSPGPSPSPRPSPSPSPGPGPSPGPTPSGCEAQCSQSSPSCDCSCFCQCNSICGDGCYDQCVGHGGCHHYCPFDAAMNNMTFPSIQV
jgi:hypothetical protein